MLLDLLVLFLPSLFLALLTTVLIHGDTPTFLSLYALAQTVVIVVSAQLAISCIVVPMLLYAVSLYLVLFPGGGAE